MPRASRGTQFEGPASDIIGITLKCGYMTYPHLYNHEVTHNVEGLSSVSAGNHFLSAIVTCASFTLGA